MASDLFLRFIINRLWEVKGVRGLGGGEGSGLLLECLWKYRKLGHNEPLRSKTVML